MRSLLLVLAVGLLLAGCGSAPTDSPPPAGGPTPSTLTQPEQQFLTAITNAIPGAPGYWSNASLIRHGYDACTSLNADGNNPEAAVTAVGPDVKDDVARVIVRAAADELCPAASAAGLSPTAPAKADTAPSSGGGVVQTKARKYVYRVLGNYRATQLHYTASNGDMVDLNNTGNINTAGSKLPWSSEATPEPNGNPNVVSASTLSAKGDSYITCTITNEQGTVVASNTGRGAYASCYASTPL